MLNNFVNADGDGKQDMIKDFMTNFNASDYGFDGNETNITDIVSKGKKSIQDLTGYNVDDVFDKDFDIESTMKSIGKKVDGAKGFYEKMQAYNEKKKAKKL